MEAIDREQLKTLSEDPALSSKQVYEQLGFKNDVTFYYQLNNTPGLRKIYDEGRAVAKGAKAESNGTGQKQSATAPRVGATAEKPRRKYKARRAGKKKTSAAPPRNGNAKAASKKFFKRLQHEFEHIDIYGATSEHFEDLRAEVATLI